MNTSINWPQVRFLKIDDKWIVKDHEDKGYLKIFSIYHRHNKSVIMLTDDKNEAEVVIKDLSLLVKQFDHMEQANISLKKHFEDPENVKRAQKWFADIEERENRGHDKILRYGSKLNDVQYLSMIRILAKWEKKFQNMQFDKNQCETSSNIINALFEVFSRNGKDITDTDDGMFLASKYEYRGVAMSLHQGQGSFITIEIDNQRIF